MRRFLLLQRQAWSAMWAHKMYALLMMIGLVIGIASVSVIIDIGQGARAAVIEHMTQLGFGADSLMIRAGSGRMFRRRGPRPTTLKMVDVEAIRMFTFVKEVVPHRRVRGQRFIYGRKSTDSFFVGTSPAFQSSRLWSMHSGRFFDDEDMRTKARVLVVGATLSKNLFGDLDPVGRIVRVGKVSFKIIGLLQRHGATAGGRDRDDMGVAPLTTVLRRIVNSDYLDVLKVDLTSPKMVPVAKKAISALLRKSHKLAAGVPDDFTIISADEILAHITRQGRTMVIMLALIAGISLFVSGIVIMNIMLVSVSERRQEIGIRRAVGATRLDIMTQFVLESILVSLAGGLLGIVLGQVVSRTLTAVLGLPTALSILSLALSLGFASTVGLTFGIVPAWRAAQLSPVEACR